MKISKEECDRKFSEKSLLLSNKKCKTCEYYYRCPYIMRSYNDVMYGD